MRLDKLTTKFQQALADAQSLAVGHDNQIIEPQHLLLALLQQDDGGSASLLAQAGVNVQALKAAWPRCNSPATPVTRCSDTASSAKISTRLATWKK